MWLVVTIQTLTVVELNHPWSWAEMDIYIHIIYQDVFTYPCHKLHIGLAIIAIIFLVADYTAIIQ